MKKLLLAFLMLITCFGMTSCNTFFTEEERAISNIRKQLGKNDEGDEGFYLIIEYTNPDIPVDRFFIPNGKDGKQGETGLEGNGIEKIETTINEVTKETTVKIIFTDKDVPEASYIVPSGVSLKGVNNVPNPDGSCTVQFEFSDGTKSDPINLPKGPKGDGFEGYQINDNEDGSKELLLKFENHDPISIILPQGKEGNGIKKVKAYTNEDFYVIEIYYTNQEPDRYELPKPNSWITGSSVPGGDVGKTGDFFFDIAHKIIYSKVDNVWIEVIKLESTVPQMCKVQFDLNDDDSPVKATLNGSSLIQVKEGTYFGMDGQKELPTASRKGYTFDGWYLKKDPTAVNGRFTDTTPVFGDLVLYANWIEDPEVQA